MPALISRQWSGPPQTPLWRISTTPEAVQQQVAPTAIYLPGQSGKALGSAALSWGTIRTKEGVILQPGRASLPLSLCFCASGLCSIINQSPHLVLHVEGYFVAFGVGFFFGWIGVIGYHVSSNYSMIMPPCKQKQIINLSLKMLIVSSLNG